MTVTNCIFWENSPVQFDNLFAAVNHSLVPGGFTCHPSVADCGVGLIDAQPMFVDAKGPDAVYGTEDDDLRLTCNSPAIAVGDDLVVPDDFFDVDGDSMTFGQSIPDLDLNERIVDGTELVLGAVVDFGTYEYHCPTCRLDFDEDGLVNFEDLLEFLAAWGPCSQCIEDLDRSGDVGFGDLLELLFLWGECEPDCHCNVQSLEEMLTASCLTNDDWNEFLNVMQSGTQEQKDNYNCWLEAHVNGGGSCDPSGSCPSSNPFIEE